MLTCSVMRRGSRVILASALASLGLMLAGVSSASALVDTQYSLADSQLNPHGSTDHCFTQYGPASYRDLNPGLPAGAGSTFAGAALFGCSPAFPAGATVGPGTVTVDAWFTNTYKKKSCATPWFLMHNSAPNHVGDVIAGTYYDNGPPFIVPANTTTPTHFQVNVTLDSATTLYPGDQLMLMDDVRTQTGTCSLMTLYYGSTARPSGVTVPQG
jgi:hypothetical protein